MVERIGLSGPSWWLAPRPARQAGATGAWHEPAWFLQHRARLRQVTVPSSWQALPGLDRYEGECWYFTTIGKDLLGKCTVPGRIARIRFNGANYITEAWFHGTRLGLHEGGFLPFTFDVPRAAIDAAIAGGGEAVLAVRVDSTRRRDQVPEFSTDWFQWGGIYRDVAIETHPALHLTRCAVTPLVAPRPDGTLARASIRIDISGITGTTFSWTVMDPAGGIAARGEHALPGTASSIVVPVPRPLAWDMDHPRLYALELTAPGGEPLWRTRFGLREIKAVDEAIMLNGRRVLLKGASLHEEKFPHGREYSSAGRRADVRAMKAMGFTMLRTAHYSHDESLLDACDELGMLAGEEIPVYWNIDYRNPRVIRLAARMLRDLVHRDYNHPCVIWWSVGNEVPVQRRDCALFTERLVRLAKRLDPTRFAVYVTKAYLADPPRRASDLLLLNSYFGWYYFSARMFGFVADMVHATAPRKPMLVTEFGGGARLGVGRREPIDRQFTEWKQASILGHAIKSFNARAHLSGWILWLWRDFKSHMRLNEYQQGYNRKGLVDERDRKKLSALWMPRLVQERNRPPGRVRLMLAEFYSKFLRLPAMLVGILVDAVAPRFMARRNEGYYTNDVHDDTEATTTT